MGAQVSIGDFAVMTSLSRKALRHYHDIGILEPAHIDSHTGYRFYDTGQVDHAHIIRRFRSLGMSIPDIKALLSTEDAAARTEIEQLLSLPSGYHRDLQSSKGAIFHGFGRGLAALELLPALLANLEWRDDKLRAAIDSGMYATDVAVEAAVAGVPFREAYKAAAAAADTAGQGRTPEGSLAARVSPGAAADLRLDELRARWAALV